MKKIIKIAFFLSGKGSTLSNLISYLKKNSIHAKIELVLASRPCLGMEIAKQNNIHTFNLNYHFYNNHLEKYSRIITSYLDQYSIDYGVMGGFLSQYLVPKKYTNKIINIHPSLIPSFCGKGFYGNKIHKAVYNARVKISGISIHFVDSNYDTGPIIFQKSIPINSYDTIKTIQNKVNKLEKKFYPLIINRLITNKISFSNKYVKL